MLVCYSKKRHLEPTLSTETTDLLAYGGSSAREALPGWATDSQLHQAPVLLLGSVPASLCGAAIATGAAVCS